MEIVIPPLLIIICMVNNGCNMGAGDLSDMYARSQRAAGPRDEGMHIRQIMSTHVTNDMYHFRV